MAKELPYFKFEPSEWMNGDIQMCNPAIRIAFLEMCCIYWVRTGELSKKMAIVKCCYGDPAVLDELISMNIVELDSENIVIKFLDEQLSEFTEIKKIRSEAGKKGGQSGGVRPEKERISGNQFYVILCRGNGEEFLKIGTTVNSVSRRYSGKMPYEYEMVLQVITDQSTAIENSLIEELAKFAYTPKLSFPGQKECFDISFFDEINDIIKSKTGFAIAKLKRNETIRVDKIIEEKTRLEETKQDERVVAVPATPDERAKVFMERIAEHLNTYPKEMLRNFYDYWTEKNEGGRRMRFEMQKVFDLKKRLATWSKRENEKINGNGHSKTGSGGAGITPEGTRARIALYDND